MAATTTKPVHSLVLDTGPIINNEPSVSTLINKAEVLYTTPAVIDEIRDATTRARVESTLLPFLKLRSPKPASVKIISDFAKKTGDAEVLSITDIQLMALAYELECERNHGDWRLRSVPGQKRLNGSPPESLKNGQAGPIPEEEKKELKLKAAVAPVKDSRGAWGTKVPESEPEPESELKPVEQTKESTVETLAVDANVEAVTESMENVQVSTDNNTQTTLDVDATPTTEAVSEPEPEPVEEEISDDSDSEGWITPSNLKKHQEKDTNTTTVPTSEAKTLQVALMTIDYAMQNVLLRMNLNLLSPSMQTIRQLKTWVLRCHACFNITKDMTKQFCGRCGQPALMRTACSTERDGTVKVHLKKNMQWSTRGNVYSIPKPVTGTANGKMTNGGGRNGWGQNLILAEDQKEYVKAMTINKRQKEKDLMDEDYLPSILSGDRGRAGGRPKVGAGRNVNSKRKK